MTGAVILAEVALVALHAVGLTHESRFEELADDQVGHKVAKNDQHDKEAAQVTEVAEQVVSLPLVDRAVIVGSKVNV